MQREIEGEESVRRAQEAWKKLREKMIDPMTWKREAYAVVANMIAECRAAREVDPATAMIPASEQPVLRALEEIENAMRAASLVQP